MTYHVEIQPRAARDLRAIYEYIRANFSPEAHDWYNGLADTIYSLEHFPGRGVGAAKKKTLRQLIYGKKPHTYRIIYAINERRRIVSVLHIRHSARAAATGKDLVGRK